MDKCIKCGTPPQLFYHGMCARCNVPPKPRPNLSPLYFILSALSRDDEDPRRLDYLLAYTYHIYVINRIEHGLEPLMEIDDETLAIIERIDPYVP